MTTNQSPSHSDYRRAAALIAHQAEGSVPGIRCILEEASTANRSTPLLIALLDAFRLIARELRTDSALQALGELIEIFTGQSGPMRAAALVTIARRDRDTARFNEVLIAANDADAAGGLLASVLELWAALLPELAAPHALRSLSTWTARIAASEDRADGDESANR
ncbi:MAG TPA: hypothetical protein PLI79_01480 [Mycobacterium sp.]|nr:hypothetical protein [Mycobacterium sp.]